MLRWTNRCRRQNRLVRNILQSYLSLLTAGFIRYGDCLVAGFLLLRNRRMPTAATATIGMAMRAHIGKAGWGAGVGAVIASV